MNKFFTKHAPTIILMMICLILGGGSSKLFDRAFPDAKAITKEYMTEMFREIIQEETAPMKADIKEIRQQYGVLADGTFEEWVRVMEKQYLKVQTNRDDLSWSDVEYALGKWEALPDDWKTPDLCAKIEYLKIKYEEHINNGGE